MAPSAEGEAAAADARPVLDVPVYAQLLARPKGTRRSLGGAVGEQDRETSIQEAAARELSAIYQGEI